MGYYDFDKQNLKRIATAQDEEAAQASGASSPQVAEKKDGDDGEERKEGEGEGNRVPKRETLAEHLQHCKAEPGNCPFEKAYNDIDNLVPDDEKVTKKQAYDRLAIAMTQMFALAADVAKTAIDDDTDSAKNVAGAIERGLEEIQKFCEEKGCTVEMDKAGSKYIITPPSKS